MGIWGYRLRTVVSNLSVSSELGMGFKQIFWFSMSGVNSKILHF